MYHSQIRDGVVIFYSQGPARYSAGSVACGSRKILLPVTTVKNEEMFRASCDKAGREADGEYMPDVSVDIGNVSGGTRTVVRVHHLYN